MSHWSHFQQFAQLSGQSSSQRAHKAPPKVPLRISELTENNSELQDQPGPAQTGTTQLQALAGEIIIFCAVWDVNFCPHLSFISLLFGESPTFLLNCFSVCCMFITAQPLFTMAGGNITKCEINPALRVVKVFRRQITNFITSLSTRGSRKITSNPCRLLGKYLTPSNQY